MTILHLNYDSIHNQTPAQIYRKELADCLDKTGYFRIPDWMLEYRGLLGIDENSMQGIFDLEKLLNKIGRGEAEILAQNVYINLIVLLIRMKKYCIVVL